jgi:hypothetical protein
MQAALAHVASKGGTVIGAPIKAKGGNTKLKVNCGKGHVWFPNVGNLANDKTWCPKCYGNAPHTIEMMRDLAEGRGGKCLSEEYNGNKTNLEWQCAFKHKKWSATPGNVKNHGSWCPECKINVGEELVRATLEEALPGQEFSRTRREYWMMGLELDGYNEEHRLAFEYQGIQHAQRVQHFHASEEDFKAQVKRDALTEERCNDNWVTLLVIPHTIKYVDIRAYVRKEIEDLDYKIEPTSCTDAEFYDKVRASGPTASRQYARALEIIARKGGTCLSKQYVSYKMPMSIRCCKGHEFMASLEAIDQPTSRGPRFCSYCGGRRKLDDAALRNRVESCGFQFLGVKSISGCKSRYMTVQCSNNHKPYAVSIDNFGASEADRYVARTELLKPKKGCRECAGQNTGDRLRDNISVWAEEKHIQLLDGPYKNQSTKYFWLCEYGHTFDASTSSLKQKKGDICVECRLETFMSTYNFKLMTSWSTDIPSTSALRWKCLDCDDESEMSVMNIALKKILCEPCLKFR